MNIQQSNKITPQQIQGTIRISNGEVININTHAISNNESNKSSKNFVKNLQKAIKEDLFKKENGPQGKK
jgi:hypothetical protein